MTTDATRGAGRLARFAVRSGWPGLVVSVAVVLGLLLTSTAGVVALYDTPAQRSSYAATMASSPNVAAINGRSYDLNHLGAIAGYEFGLMAALIIPVVAIRLAIRMTRGEEDSGRTDLVTARPVGRLAPLLAAALLQVVLAGAITVLATAGLTALGLPFGGSLAYSAGLGLTCLTFGTVGLLAGQVAQDARTAYGLALGTTLAFFLLRALVDGKGWTLTWLSPLGWLAEIRPWGSHPAWWPWPAFAGLLVLLGLLTTLAAATRDLGGGLVATRPGPAVAGASLSGSTGWAWRMTAPTVVGWFIGAAALSGTVGLLAADVTDLLDTNPDMLTALGIDRPEDAVLPMGLLLAGSAAIAVVVQGISRLVGEESSGRFGLLLAAPEGRSQAWLRWWFVVALEGLLVLLGGAAALGLTVAASTDDTGALGRALQDGAWFAVPVVLVAALAAAVHSVRPQLVVALWTVPLWTIMVGFLATSLRLPRWSQELSPLEAVSGDARGLVTAALMVAVAVLLGLGLRAFGRRDLLAG